MLGYPIRLDGCRMLANADVRLESFNTLALSLQDDAYTLAYYLTGDEASAAEVTQTAFENLYRRSGHPTEQIRISVLRWILENAREEPYASSQAISRDPQSRQLLDLPAYERAVAVLIDVLGYGYVSAAQVLGTSKKQTGRLLARARLHAGRREKAV